LNKISSKFPNCFTNINNKIIYSNIENKNDLVNKKENENDKNNEEVTEQNNNINNLEEKEPENNYNLSLNANKDELFDKIKNTKIKH